MRNKFMSISLIFVLIVSQLTPSIFAAGSVNTGMEMYKGTSYKYGWNSGNYTSGWAGLYNLEPTSNATANGNAQVIMQTTVTGTNLCSATKSLIKPGGKVECTSSKLSKNKNYETKGKWTVINNGWKSIYTKLD